MDLYNCWTCDKEFDRFQTSATVCDDCKRNESIKKAEDSIGKRVEVCYSIIPGSWSPYMEYGRVLKHVGDGHVLITTDSGKSITTNDYLVLLEQQAVSPQLTLF